MQVRQRRNKSNERHSSSSVSSKGTITVRDGSIFCVGVIVLVCIILYYQLDSNTDSSNITPNTSPNSESKASSPSSTSGSKIAEVLPLIPKLADYHREILTSNDISQEYFNQAMVLSFAFNHDEAIRSLEYAIKLDSNCAMCYWAMSYNHGFNINREISKERLNNAIKYAHMGKNISNNDKYKQDIISQSLIDVMLIQFPKQRTIDDDNNIYLKKYMNAFGELINKFENENDNKNEKEHQFKDSDLYALYAESIMNTMAWDYYKGYHNQEIPKDDTKIVYEMLNKCLDISPNHLLGLHLYIHIYEASLTEVHSTHVEEKADRLRDIVTPNMGIEHLIHMYVILCKCTCM